MPKGNLQTFVPIDTDKYSLHLWSRKCLFATDRDHHRKPQPIKMLSREALSQWIYLQNTLTPKTWGTLWRRWWKDCKSRRITEFSVRLCLLVISEAIPIKSYNYDCSNASWPRIAPIDVPNRGRKSPQASTIHKELQATEWSWRGDLPQKREHHLVVQC